MGALALEIAAAYCLIGVDGETDLLGFLEAHLAGSLLLAQSLLPSLRASLPSAQLYALFLVCLFAPGIGLLVIAGSVSALRFVPRKENSPDAGNLVFVSVDSPKPEPRIMNAWARSNTDLYDEAGFSAVLRWSKDPERRYRAVLRSQRLRESESVKVLQLALRDPEDEVRLVAYGLLERKTQAITDRMGNHQDRLGCSRSPNEAAALHRALAYDAWQLVDLGLVQGEVSRHFLNVSRRHLNQAIDILPCSPGLHFLLGKVLSCLGDQETAAFAFSEAQRFGLAPSKNAILPSAPTTEPMSAQPLVGSTGEGFGTTDSALEPQIRVQHGI